MKEMQVKKPLKNSALVTSVLVAMLGLSHTAAAEDAMRHKDHITWTKSANTPFVAINPNTLAANEANLFFIRPLDKDGLQTSANIGIDGRFQVSLQPGHYSQVSYCSGQHNISVAPTGLKTNDLSNAFSHIVEFAPQQNHYIYVDIDNSTGQPSLSKLEEADAKKLLSTQLKQTHQISRVVANCPEIVEPEPAIKVEIDKPINLEVLFEFDKAVVQPVFNQYIEAVANFMHKYPETTTVIEGHTDSKGSDSYNMKLSQRRAEAVKQELVVKYGIAPNRLRTVGYGETRPVDTNATATGRHNNRRVVAMVSATQK
ncbi:OmpA family protein [Psychrobacter phenylpyruvicus]|uniref:Outer membrane porin F n=1 Tax=Psychrobacter phenylpyruvicus TaxID=29432 RepID=A0A379LQI0_9GAMM|nr:OmpA family protein [Psychrobacter phenylpyruvicus]SUD92014.1 Outer membrane porin F precursor [Psychrobacter phenylpyruvicus]